MTGRRDVERERLLKKIAEKRARLEARGDLKIKIPRLTLPSDYNVHDRSLFSLPQELLRPIIASGHSKYQKKLKAESKKATERESKMRSYTILRKQREEFRQRLVQLIVAKEGDDDVEGDALPSSEEKEMLRYYYYIKHGVDTIHVAPLDEKVLNRVLNLVPARLKKWKQTMTESIDDMKEDFMMAVKKAIVDYVLQDPTFTKSLAQQVTPFRQELNEIGNSFRPCFNAGKLKMERNLHVVNPCLSVLLDIWYTRFRKVRLVDVEILKQHEGAFDLQDFKHTIIKHIAKAKDKIMQEYYYIVTDIFLQGAKRNKLPDPSKPKKMKSFFNSVATVMTYQLQSLCLKSLYDFVSYITDIKYSNKGFVVNLVLRINVLVFDPPFKSFKEVLLSAIDSLIEAVMDIPRLETQLYLDWSQTVEHLRPSIPEETIWAYKERIKDLLEDQRIGPELRVQDFDNYMSLINGDDEQELKKFMEGEHTFEEYAEKITKYKAIMDTVTLLNQHYIRMEMYDMNRTELIKALEEAASNFREMLIQRCISDYQHLCKQYPSANMRGMPTK